jgi:hypothetical protein
MDEEDMAGEPTRFGLPDKTYVILSKTYWTMKIFPEDKKRKIALIVILAVVAAVLVYMFFFRGGPGEPDTILTPVPGQEAGEGAGVFPTQSLQSRLLPYGTKIDSGVFEDERFRILRSTPDLTVSEEELGNPNPFTLSP